MRTVFLGSVAILSCNWLASFSEANIPGLQPSAAVVSTKTPSSFSFSVYVRTGWGRQLGHTCPCANERTCHGRRQGSSVIYTRIIFYLRQQDNNQVGVLCTTDFVELDREGAVSGILKDDIRAEGNLSRGLNAEVSSVVLQLSSPHSQAGT
jgi:hypothetical protein